MSQLPPLSPTKGKTSPTPRPESNAYSRQEYLAPEPVHLPGVDQCRNPILGTMIPYSQYSPQQHRPSANGVKNKSTHHKVIHSGSMFEDTSIRPNFYIIAPDWPSETRSARRLAKQRSHYSWDSRPAFRPLNDYIIPLLERRRSCESRLNDALLSARQSASQYRPTATHAHTSLKALPPTQSRDEPTRKSLPTNTQNRDYTRPAASGSQFYKSMLASEVLAPRRELTCPNLVHY